MSRLVSPIWDRVRREPVANEAKFADAIRDLWHSRGDIHVRADEVRGFPAVVRMALEAHAISKWGKRNA